jgi:hypothetical protein
MDIIAAKKDILTLRLQYSKLLCELAEEIRPPLIKTVFCAKIVLK